MSGITVSYTPAVRESTSRTGTTCTPTARPDSDPWYMAPSLYTPLCDRM